MPLPALEDLPPTELRAVHEGLVAKIEADHAGKQVLGAKHPVEQAPEPRPEDFVPSPAPRCHARSPPACLRFNKCYRTFRDGCCGGSDRVRQRPELADAWLHGTDDIDAFEVPF